MRVDDLFEDQVKDKSDRVRLTVSVPADALAVYRRLADISGASVGRSIGDWLSDTAEGAQAMIEMIEMAKAQPLRAAVQVHAAAVKANSLTFELMQKLSSDDEGSSSGWVGRGTSHARTGEEPSSDSDARSGAVGGLTPPYSNTGGKGSKTSRKTKK